MAKQFILTECDGPLASHQAHVDLEKRLTRLEAEAWQNSRRIESLQSQVRKLFAEQRRASGVVGMPETAPEAETVPTEYRQDRFRFIEDVLRAMSDHLGRIEEQLARKPGSKK